ncbi:hypothetical protein JW960_22630 [candidate division KSB1 bacterium]|nr:hypothetical protein [candidate division KSB1 bacterium]
MDQDALAIELKLRQIPFIEQPRLLIDFKGHQLKATYIPDYL